MVRYKRLAEQTAFTKLAAEKPSAVANYLLKGVRACGVPEEVVAKHFTPTYRPWQQRLAFVPDGDLFRAIVAGKASIVTDQIARFTETGLLLKSGERLEADVVITATGFNMTALGDAQVVVDGKAVDVSECVAYRGLMLTGAEIRASDRTHYVDNSIAFLRL